MSIPLSYYGGDCNKFIEALEQIVTLDRDLLENSFSRYHKNSNYPSEIVVVNLWCHKERVYKYDYGFRYDSVDETILRFDKLRSRLRNGLSPLGYRETKESKLIADSLNYRQLMSIEAGAMEESNFIDLWDYNSIWRTDYSEFKLQIIGDGDPWFISLSLRPRKREPGYE
ncbi:hypothetical protein [Microbulbifer variabilis]|uniref:hypothetical protein n=1 Tax=Microbulbifer variabilis TaxID=266805 RepID=UPI001CFDA8FF|nr:hypothetical protein [Microbulbifer variabilis]